jgi:2-iminobutanoate/2-iminopropanoate deaminase
MKYVLTCLIAFAVAGCSICKNAMREMVQQELAKGAEKNYYTQGQTIAPYTPAIRVGGFLFISGQIGLKPGSSELAGPDFENETRQVLDNIIAILKNAGYDASDVLQCTVYLKDINDFAKMNSVYSTYFQPGRFPTRAAVEVSNLVRNARIEVSALAYRAK